jgi:hypothetical protein
MFSAITITLWQDEVLISHTIPWYPLNTVQRRIL